MRLVCALPSDRRQSGEILVEDESGALLIGPFPARGKADGEAAAAHGNPARDVQLPFGDHPAGEYSVLGVEWGKLPAHSFGSGFILLAAESGDAHVREDAEPGPDGIGIHGGPLGPGGVLRATHGCLRVSDEAVREIGTLVEKELAAGRPVTYTCTQQSPEVSPIT